MSKLDQDFQTRAELERDFAAINARVDWANEAARKAIGLDMSRDALQIKIIKRQLAAA